MSDYVQVERPGSWYPPRKSWDHYRQVDLVGNTATVETFYVHENTGLVVADIEQFEYWLRDVAKIEWDED